MLDSQPQQENQYSAHLNNPVKTLTNEIKQLVEQAVAGDKQAFNLLISNVYIDIYRFSFHLTKNQTRAEDLTHDVVLKIAKSIKQFNFDSTFLSWVYRIVVNTQKDNYKKQTNRLKRDSQYYTEHQLQYSSSLPEDEVEFNELLSAIDQLPEKLKITLVLVYAEHLSHADAADVLQCSTNTISWRIHEAKKQLKTILEKQS